MTALPPLARPSRAFLRDLLIVAGIVAALWVMHRLGRIVLVLILAMFLAYVIAPLVDRVQQTSVRGRTYRMPRAAAVTIVYLLLVGAAVGGVALLWPSASAQLDDAVASSPKYLEAFRAWERGWSRYYERLRIPIELRHGIEPEMHGVIFEQDAMLIDTEHGHRAVQFLDSRLATDLRVRLVEVP